MGRVHVVARGEGTTALSERYGFDARFIWDHPENAALRARRRDMNQLLPGDELHIPDLRPRSEACETGARHRFRRRGVPARYRVQIAVGAEVAAGCAWELVVDGARLTGTTDDDGVLDTPVPASATVGELTLHLPTRRMPVKTSVRFGYLHPIEEPSGVVQRLANLGYAVAADAPADGAEARNAIAAFQRRHALPETGEVDAETRARLGAMHDTRQRPGRPGAKK